MIYLWATLLVIANAAALALTLFMLPGNWVMVALTLAVAWWQADGEMFSVPVLASIVVLALVGEIVEFTSSAAGARRAGASRVAGLFAIVGAVVGAILGTALIPVPVIGTLIGLAAGAFAGACAIELVIGRGVAGAVRSGVGAGAGGLAGTVLKFLIGAAIWLIVAVAAFWP